MLFAAAIVLAGCNSTTSDSTSAPSDPATETFAASLNVNISKMTKTTNGVYYSDTKVGTGRPVAGLPSVTVTYKGYLRDGTVFDPGGSTVFSLGGLIFGFQEGMQGMQEGGERILVIPSALGYGPNAQGPIPANSTLVFDVVLTKIN